MSENRAHDPLADDEHDLVLPVWSVEKTMTKTQEEAERSARRLRAIRERRGTKERTPKGSGDS